MFHGVFVVREETADELTVVSVMFERYFFASWESFAVRVIARHMVKAENESSVYFKKYLAFVIFHFADTITQSDSHGSHETFLAS